MNDQLVSIKLKFVPFYSVIRYENTWWYYMPPCESPENAVEIESQDKQADNIKSMRISNEAVVAAYAYELSKKVMPYAKSISLF